MTTLVICSPGNRQPIADALHLPVGEVAWTVEPDFTEAMDYYVRMATGGHRVERFVCDSAVIAHQLRDFAGLDERVELFEDGQLGDVL